MPIDLETTPLEIKTVSQAVEDNQISMTMYFRTVEGEMAGGLSIYIDPTPTYYLTSCASNRNFSTNLSATRNKIWKITLSKISGIRLQIHCNGIEVANVLLSDTICRSNWRERWNRDIERVEFIAGDSASEYYRLSNEGKFGNFFYT